MSDDKAQQEPSMEDILASIRRILSEDDAEEAVKSTPPAAPPKAPAAPPPKAAEPPPPPPEPELEADLEPEPEPEAEPEPFFEAEPEEDVLELTDDMVADDEPAEAESEADLSPFEPEPVPRMTMMPVEDEEEPGSLLSRPVQDASTSTLAELARAVARERGIGLGNGGLTLEDLTREILKSLIKDWLDQNLPYMIERIVKKEIEKMVNRAEKL